MTNFTKPAKTTDELYSLLVKRGLETHKNTNNLFWKIFTKNNTEKEIKKDLENIGYYRLSGYFKYFQDTNNNFFPGISFDKVLDYYIFDRKLRLLTFDAIEKIEVSVKANINNYMSLKYGVFWYTDQNNFQLTTSKKTNTYNEFMKKVHKIQGKGSGQFIKSYFKKYASESYLASWMLVEELTIGELSTIFYLLKTQDREDISKYYKTYEKDFGNWLHLLNILRNISAHHGRLWNRKYVIKLKTSDVLFKNYFQTFINNNGHSEVKANYYNAILVMFYLLDNINKNFGWLDDLEKLINKYSNIVDIGKMGLSKKWKKEIIGIIK